MGDSIKDILEKSDKAEIIERLSEVLGTDGCRIVIVTGVPKPDGGLEMHVEQAGHKYVYEVVGYLQEGIDIIQALPKEEDGED